MATTKGLTIPTGYEQYQRSAEQRRQIARAMLAQGLQPLNNPTSFAQVLGQWAQGFAGNRMMNQADQMDDRTNELILGDYNSRRQRFYEDAKTMDLPTLTRDYGGDQLLQADLKPYQDALARQLSERQKLVKHNGRLVPAGEAVGLPDNDPNALIWQNPDGSTIINGPRVTAGAMVSGALVPEDGKYPQTGQLPGVTPPLTLDQVKSEGAALLRGPVVPVTDPVTGKIYYKLGNKVYDQNPDGGQ